MVPEDGLEPSLLSKSDFESDVSTNSTTQALLLDSMRWTSRSEANYTFGYRNGKHFDLTFLSTEQNSASVAKNALIPATEFTLANVSISKV